MERRNTTITSEEATARQTAAFSKWANYQLEKGGFDHRVNNINEDLRDGVLLMHLLHQTTGIPIPKYTANAKNQIMRLNNMTQVFDMVKKAQITLIGIGTNDIVDNNPGKALALLWAIIYAQRIGSIKGLEGNTGGGRVGLLLWVNRNVSEYGIPEVKDFTKAWVDGLALAALADKVCSGLWKAMKPLEPAERVAKCITELKAKGVPELLEAKDLVKNPDDKSTMMYIGEVFHVLSSSQQQETKASRVTKFVNVMKIVGEGVKEYNSSVDELDSQLGKLEKSIAAAEETLKRLAVKKAKIEKGEDEEESDADEAEDPLQESKEVMTGLLKVNTSRRHKIDALKTNVEGALKKASLLMKQNKMKPIHERHAAKFAGSKELMVRLDAALKHSREVFAFFKHHTVETYSAGAIKIHSDLKKAVQILDDVQVAVDGMKKGDDAADVKQKLAKLVERCERRRRESMEVLLSMSAVMAQAEVFVEDPDVPNVEALAAENAFCLAEARRLVEVIEMRELQSQGSALSKEKLQEIQSTFSHFDTDGSGTLDQDEFFNCLLGLGHNATEQSAAETFKKYVGKAAATDGTMTLDQFVAFMTTMESDAASAQEIVEALKGLGEMATLAELAGVFGNEENAAFFADAMESVDGKYKVKAYLATAFDA